MAGRYVSYLRVSTQRQGRSGLGLEAQRSAVVAHAGGGAILREFVEIESGKKPQRPQLAAALRECRLTGATLLVAKLDRLARKASFLLTLRDSGVAFVCADNPSATNLTIGVLAVVAEDEAQRISERTRAALAAAKRRGRRLGGRRAGSFWRPGAQRRGAAARTAAADAFAREIGSVLREIGPGSLRAIAGELTRRNIRTPQGGAWTATAVKRLQDRLARLDS
jgi:DNA invertase Pin-like site-specific DNA recombinase